MSAYRSTLMSRTSSIRPGIRGRSHPFRDLRSVGLHVATWLVGRVSSQLGSPLTGLTANRFTTLQPPNGVEIAWDPGSISTVLSRRWQLDSSTLKRMASATAVARTIAITAIAPRGVTRALELLLARGIFVFRRCGVAKALASSFVEELQGAGQGRLSERVICTHQCGHGF